MKITNEIIESTLFCKYKSYLLQKGIKGDKTDYEIFYKSEKEKLEQSYLEVIEQIKLNNDNLKSEYHYELNQQIDTKIFSINFFAFEKSIFKNKEKGYSIIPVFLLISDRITQMDKILITCLCYTLKDTKYGLPESVKIILGKSFLSIKFNPKPHYKRAERLISDISDSEPPFVLNNHCSICEFRNICKEKAINEDSISLLDRVTTKTLEKYKKKGLFTIKQISMIYKPRKNKKKRSNRTLIHNVELQALAIKTNKIYIHQLPDLIKKQNEIFIDFEGIPERNIYYLMGVIIIENEKLESYSLWAENDFEEEKIWMQFISIINKYPDAPIYHYGKYELKAIETLAERYNTDTNKYQQRLVNLNGFIFGKIYFPTYSNRLKELGQYLNFKWTYNDFSGIQSIIWRLRWEDSRNEQYISQLMIYNLEDCKALISLLECLININENASSMREIDFVNKPKELVTNTSIEIFTQFGNILKFAHFGYDSNKITFQDIHQDGEIIEKKVNNLIGHKGISRKTTKANKIIQIPHKSTCPIHHSDLTITNKIIEHTITDFVFSKNSIRKTIVKYSSFKSYCPICNKMYSPSEIEEIRNNFLGYSYKCWIVYQRLCLRLSINIIKLNLKVLFNEHISEGGITFVLMNFSKLYEKTNEDHLVKILESPFIHVDETKINVRGENHYVWIFTDGKYVYFKETTTRETTIVIEILKNYKGILVADFYPGYEAITCKHQKCWVHLIRDMNEDLRKNPFDSEYEIFITDLRNLIIPIFETIKKYGSKKRHFNKFQKEKDKFYNNKIIGATYNSEITLKYQTRIKKNWTALFTFLEYDNIPWNNNTAERGLRHLAVQRKISTFFSNGINQYLIFLGIMQTCKFKNKSFLDFLLSKRQSI